MSFEEAEKRIITLGEKLKKEILLKRYKWFK
jgi:acyl-CoA-binding protein